MLSLQSLALAYLRRTATSEIAFWKMATTSVFELKTRAESIITESGVGEVCELESIPGAGSVPVIARTSEDLPWST